MFEPGACPSLPAVEALWDRELDPEQAAAVHLHLAGCPQCAAELEQLERYSGLLREGDPAEPLSPVIARRVQQQLHTRAAGTLISEVSPEPARRPRRWTGVRTFMTLAPAIAASVAMFAGAKLWLLRSVEVKVVRQPSRPVDARPLVERPLGPRQAPRPPVLPQHLPRHFADASTVPDKEQPDTPRAISRPAKTTVLNSPAVAATRSNGGAPGRAVTSPPRVAAERQPAPKERLVVEVNGVAAPSEATPASISLYATGSPDAEVASVIVVRTYSEESPQ